LVLLVLTRLAKLPGAAAAGGGGEFDMGLVLRCAREAPDGAVRNAALVLLGELARRSPEQMLVHVLEALSLIQESAAMLEDSHSQAIAAQTLAAIVPPWLEAGKGADQLWSSLIQALPKVPPHRRLGLLLALLEAVPEDQGLSVALLLLLQQVAGNQGTASGSSSKSAKKASKQQQPDEAEAGEKPDDVSWLQDMAAALCEKVSPLSRLQAYAALLSSSLKAPPAPATAALPRLAVAFVSAQLQVPSITSLTSHAPGSVAAASSSPELQAACQAIMTESVLHLQQLHPTSGSANGAMQSPAKSHARAVKAATAGLYDLLQALVKVMAPGPYLSALVSLVDHESDKVRRKALKLFADRLSKVVLDLVDLELLPTELRERQQQQLANAAMSVWERLPRLLSVEHLPSAASRQQALAAAQLAIRAFGAQPRAAKVALTALPALLSAAGKDGSSAVRASALACLAAMAVALNTQLVRYVPKVADTVLSTAEAAVKKLAAAAAEASPEDEAGEEEQGAAAGGAPDAALEIAAAVAALESLAEALGAFMSPYLPRLLQLLLHPVVLGCSEGGAAATSAASAVAVQIKQLPK